VLLSLLSTSLAAGQSMACEVDLDVAAEDAIAAVTDDELTWARDIVDSSLARLECAARVVDPQDLATLYQARAAAAFYAAHQLDWAPDLQASIAANPGWFNDRLGPDLRLVWEAASAGVVGLASVHVAPIPDDGVLYVDGRLSESQPVDVLPGPHLIQVAVGAEVGFAWAGELAHDQELVLETGLPEPTVAQPIRDNPFLVAGAGFGLATAGAYYPVWAYGTRFREGSQAFADGTVSDQERDWRRFRAMEAGLVAGVSLATAALMGHAVVRLRARRDG